MIKNNLLHEYAKLIVKKGVNLQEGQIVLIKAPVEVYEFTRIVVEEAYKAGASKVLVEYNDIINTRNDYVYQNTDILKEVTNYEIDKAHYLVDKKYCAISLTSPNVEALTGLDAKKIQARMQARNKELAFYNEYTMNNDGQWCVAAVSSANWANKVFPNNPDQNNKLHLEKLIQIYYLELLHNYNKQYHNCRFLLRYIKVRTCFQQPNHRYHNKSHTPLLLFVILYVVQPPNLDSFHER